MCISYVLLNLLFQRLRAYVMFLNSTFNKRLIWKQYRIVLASHHAYALVMLITMKKGSRAGCVCCHSAIQNALHLTRPTHCTHCNQTAEYYLHATLGKLRHTQKITCSDNSRRKEPRDFVVDSKYSGVSFGFNLPTLMFNVLPWQCMRLKGSSASPFPSL